MLSSPGTPLFRDSQDRLRSRLLDEISWLDYHFGTALQPPRPPYLVLKQTHSADVLSAGAVCSSQGVDSSAHGDGLHTNEIDFGIAVKTADCIPVVLADPARRAIAVIHSGWRGTLAGVVPNGVQAMRAAYGTEPHDLVAVAGPSIGPCCFHVDPEVGTLFRCLFPERSDLDQRTTIDLREAVRRQLRGAGLTAERVSVEAPCTCCCGGREFYSWRRDKIAGQRMYTMARIRP